MNRIGGMFANLPTPFSKDGSRIDFAVMRERIEWLIEAGIHGFSTQLSAGEFAYLGLGERRSLTQVVMEAVNGRARSWSESRATTLPNRPSSRGTRANWAPRRRC